MKVIRVEGEKVSVERKRKKHKGIVQKRAERDKVIK